MPPISAASASPPPDPVRHPDEPTPSAPGPVRHLDAAEPAPTPMGSAPAAAAEWSQRWPALVELVNRKDRMLAGVLRDCRAVDAAPGRLVVGAPFGFHEEQLRNRLPKLLESITEFTGAPTTVDILFVGGKQDGPAPDAAAGDGPATQPAEPSPDTTQAVLSAFPGSRITGSRLRDHAHD